MLTQNPYTNVLSGCINNHSKLKTPQGPSIDEWIDLLYPYNGILTIKHNCVDESQRHYTREINQCQKLYTV